MTLHHLSRLLTSLTGAALLIASLQADVVETKDGARLVGKVVKIDGTHVVLDTPYAGTLSIKQGQVASVQTDSPLFVRLENGTVLQGTLSSASGQLQISGPAGALNSSVDKVAATWAPGDTDPAIAALQRSWQYEAAVDITGKTGNKEQSGLAGSFRAILKGSEDTLQFYSGYNRQVSDGEKSADQFKAGGDYQNNFAGRKSWYVRDEGGFDRIKHIQLYNTAAAGVGYDLIKKPLHTLTARVGLAYRYEGYESPDPVGSGSTYTVAPDDVNSPGLDIGFKHRYQFESSLLVNSLDITPTFDDFANYRLLHESYYELPLASTSWKLRLGVANDYNSKPGGKGIDRLDTTYFTRLVLNWK